MSAKAFDPFGNNDDDEGGKDNEQRYFYSDTHSNCVKSPLSVPLNISHQSTTITTNKRPAAGASFDPFGIVDEEDDHVSFYSHHSNATSAITGNSYFGGFHSGGRVGGTVASQFPGNISFDASFDSTMFRFSAAKSDTTIDLFSSGTKDMNIAFDNDNFLPQADCNDLNKSVITFENDKETNDMIPSAVPSSPAVVTEEIPIHCALHEEMTCVYDSISKSTCIKIEGTIHVRPTPELDGNFFYLVLKDKKGHVGNLTSYLDCVTELTPGGEPHYLESENNEFVTLHQEESGNRVFRMSIPGLIEGPQSIQVIKYTCNESLRPIPILVQTKVRIAGKLCCVGVKIRSNPSNKLSLTNLAILMAVPPDVNGDTVKMSRSDGEWDSMKRIIVWSVPELTRGETMDLQVQFEAITPAGSDGKDAMAGKNPSPKFPVLVRCDVNGDQLSGLEIEVGGSNDYASSGLHLDLHQSYRLFHRKV